MAVCAVMLVNPPLGFRERLKANWLPPGPLQGNSSTALSQSALAAVTNTTDWVACKQLFLTVLKAGKPKINELADRVSAGFTAAVLLLGPHVAGGENKLPWGLLSKGARLITGPHPCDPTSWPSHLPRLHLQAASHWGLGFNIWVWGRLKYSVHSKYYTTQLKQHWLRYKMKV